MAFKNIDMVKLFESVDLTLKHTFLRFSLNSSDVNHFNSYFLFSFVVSSAIDHRAETSANNVLESVGIVLNFFA